MHALRGVDSSLHAAQPDTLAEAASDALLTMQADAAQPDTLAEAANDALLTMQAVARRGSAHDRVCELATKAPAPNPFR